MLYGRFKVTIVASDQFRVPEYWELRFFLGTDAYIVACGDFYSENQHQLFDLHWNGLFVLPRLINVEDFSYESRSQTNVFQTQNSPPIEASLQELRQVS